MQPNNTKLSSTPIAKYGNIPVYGFATDQNGNQVPLGADGYPVVQTPDAAVNPMKQSEYKFKFLSYHFNKESLTATFTYQGIDNYIFTEKVIFADHPEKDKRKKFNVLDDPQLNELLDRAMFLAFMLIGTSYYKAHPTPYVEIPKEIDPWQTEFFNKVYQEGLSQYAYQNGLSRNNLAHFKPTTTTPKQPIPYKGNGILSLQSGGKDSLLVANLLLENNISFVPWYVSSSEDKSHPAVLDNIFPQLVRKNASIAVRLIDLFHLEQTKGLNGHVPVTFITESLALIQAILNNQNIILTSIGQEGAEPAGFIGDLPVNHQWSKTYEAEQLMSEYIKRYISADIHLGSPIRKYSELRVTELFIEKCWQRFGYQFSSCNEANYKQQQQNNKLAWCSECAKCANTYLLFCPFLAPQVLQSLFNDTDLFQNPKLVQTFKGLLGIDGVTKPFECVGSYDELRFAYHHRMAVPPQKLQKIAFRHSDMENTAANIAQASERLGLNKFFNKNTNSQQPVEFNPEGNNGQFGSSYGKKNQNLYIEQLEAQQIEPQEIKYDKNGKPIMPQLPAGWYQPLYAKLPFNVPMSSPEFDYRKEYESLPFFKNFFEEHRSEKDLKEESILDQEDNNTKSEDNNTSSEDNN